MIAPTVRRIQLSARELEELIGLLRPLEHALRLAELLAGQTAGVGDNGVDVQPKPFLQDAFELALHIVALRD